MVQVFVRSFTFDSGAHEPLNRLFLAIGSHLCKYVLARLLLLKVGLAVEILRLNVTDTFWQSAVQEDKIGRERLILIYLYNAAYLKLKALRHLAVKRSTGISLTDLIILRLVLLGPLAILKEVLGHRDSHDEE